MDKLVEKITTIAAQKELVLVAVDGVGGAGKSTLANNIKQRFTNVTIIQMDDFYSPDLKRPDVNRVVTEVLQPLRKQLPFTYNIYDWPSETFVKSSSIIPIGIFVIEGVFSLDKSLREYYDLKVWIRCSPEDGLQRGLTRDRLDYGIDTSDKWINDWMPLEKSYRESQHPLECADFVFES